MIWSPQICQFCQKQYASQRQLYNHLTEYTGEWRLPTDGIHDVLQIEQVIRRFYPSAYQADEDLKYKCWTCSMIITSRWRFTEHVVYWGHCGVDPKSLSGRRMDFHKWSLPFDEKTVLFREEPFPFLRLPQELRHMVYRLLLCFEEVKIGESLRYRTFEPRKDGIWLQNNPDNNPLAIMSVSSQIYHEARQVFYSNNKFIFESLDCLPIFLVGIGLKNAVHLQSVACKQESGNFQDYTDRIQSCIRQAATAADASTGDLPVRNVEDLYMDLASEDRQGYRLFRYYWESNHRLLRLDNPSVPTGSRRTRFTLHITLRQAGKSRENDEQMYIAAFQLNVQKKEAHD